MLLDAPPEAQLDIYPNLVVLTRRDRGGGWRSYPVNPDAIAQVLGRIPQSSGLLPPHTLSTGLLDGAAFYVVYVPPRSQTLTVAVGDKDATYTIITPPLLWTGRGRTYHIYALNVEGYPVRVDLALCRAPFPNVYDDGSICWGDSDPRPEAAPATIMAALDLFLAGSRFNFHIAGNKSKRRPTNVVGVYADLLPGEPYPLDDLVTSGRSLGWLIGGGPWQGGAR